MFNDYSEVKSDFLTNYINHSVTFRLNIELNRNFRFIMEYNW